DDIEGATVFLGPQGGGAFNAAKGWIEATTGLVVGEDYEAITSNWQTGYQAFLDGTIDMYVNGCLDPCQQFLQFTETETLRFIGPDSDQGEAVDAWLGKWRYRAEVPAGLYEGQLNDGPVASFDTSVGISVRADLDEETVYRVTKSFWDNLDSVTSDAPWAKALDIEFAAAQRGLMQLHPGAERYYREVGAIK
ncbi:MAG: TAXI family TRAP transporter solute-binding subunit, partial [Pseudomonadota bacterium]